METTQIANGVQNETGNTNDNTVAHDGTEQRTDVSLKKGQIVKYTDKDGGVLHTAKVLGRAGKAMGKYKNWYNLLYIEPTHVAGTTESADMSRVENLEVVTNDVPLTNVDDTNVTNVCENIFVTKDVSFDLQNMLK